MIQSPDRTNPSDPVSVLEFCEDVGPSFRSWLEDNSRNTEHEQAQRQLLCALCRTTPCPQGQLDYFSPQNRPPHRPPVQTHAELIDKLEARGFVMYDGVPHCFRCAKRLLRDVLHPHFKSAHGHSGSLIMERIAEVDDLSVKQNGFVPALERLNLIVAESNLHRRELRSQNSVLGQDDDDGDNDDDGTDSLFESLAFQLFRYRPLGFLLRLIATERALSEQAVYQSFVCPKYFDPTMTAGYANDETSGCPPAPTSQETLRFLEFLDTVSEPGSKLYPKDSKSNNNNNNTAIRFVPVALRIVASYFGVNVHLIDPSRAIDGRWHTMISAPPKTSTGGNHFFSQSSRIEALPGDIYLLATLPEIGNNSNNSPSDLLLLPHQQQQQLPRNNQQQHRNSSTTANKFFHSLVASPKETSDVVIPYLRWLKATSLSNVITNNNNNNNNIKNNESPSASADELSPISPSSGSAINMLGSRNAVQDNSNHRNERSLILPNSSRRQIRRSLSSNSQNNLIEQQQFVGTAKTPTHENQEDENEERDFSGRPTSGKKNLKNNVKSPPRSNRNIAVLANNNNNNKTSASSSTSFRQNHYRGLRSTNPSPFELLDDADQLHQVQNIGNKNLDKSSTQQLISFDTYLRNKNASITFGSKIVLDLSTCTFNNSNGTNDSNNNNNNNATTSTLFSFLGMSKFFQPCLVFNSLVSSKNGTVSGETNAVYEDFLSKDKISSGCLFEIHPVVAATNEATTTGTTTVLELGVPFCLLHVDTGMWLSLVYETNNYDKQQPPQVWISFSSSKQVHENSSKNNNNNNDIQTTCWRFTSCNHNNNHNNNKTCSRRLFNFQSGLVLESVPSSDITTSFCPIIKTNYHRSDNNEQTSSSPSSSPPRQALAIISKSEINFNSPSGTASNRLAKFRILSCNSLARTQSSTNNEMEKSIFDTVPNKNDDQQYFQLFVRSPFSNNRSVVAIRDKEVEGDPEFDGELLHLIPHTNADDNSAGTEEDVELTLFRFEKVLASTFAKEHPSPKRQNCDSKKQDHGNYYHRLISFDGREIFSIVPSSSEFSNHAKLESANAGTSLVSSAWKIISASPSSATTKATTEEEKENDNSNSFFYLLNDNDKFYKDLFLSFTINNTKNDDDENKQEGMIHLSPSFDVDNCKFQILPFDNNNNDSDSSLHQTSKKIQSLATCCAQFIAAVTAKKINETLLRVLCRTLQGSLGETQKLLLLLSQDSTYSSTTQSTSVRHLISNFILKNRIIFHLMRIVAELIPSQRIPIVAAATKQSATSTIGNNINNNNALDQTNEQEEIQSAFHLIAIALDQNPSLAYEFVILIFQSFDFLTVFFEHLRSKNLSTNSASFTPSPQKQEQLRSLFFRVTKFAVEYCPLVDLRGLDFALSVLRASSTSFVFSPDEIEQIVSLVIKNITLNRENVKHEKTRTTRGGPEEGTMDRNHQQKVDPALFGGYFQVLSSLITTNSQNSDASNNNVNKKKPLRGPQNLTSQMLFSSPETASSLLLFALSAMPSKNNSSSSTLMITIPEILNQHDEQQGNQNFSPREGNGNSNTQNVNFITLPLEKIILRAFSSSSSSSTQQQQQGPNVNSTTSGSKYLRLIQSPQDRIASREQRAYYSAVLDSLIAQLDLFSDLGLGNNFESLTSIFSFRFCVASSEKFRDTHNADGENEREDDDRKSQQGLLLISKAVLEALCFNFDISASLRQENYFSEMYLRVAKLKASALRLLNVLNAASSKITLIQDTKNKGDENGEIHQHHLDTLLPQRNNCSKAKKNVISISPFVRHYGNPATGNNNNNNNNHNHHAIQIGDSPSPRAPPRQQEQQQQQQLEPTNQNQVIEREELLKAEISSWNNLFPQEHQRKNNNNQMNSSSSETRKLRDRQEAFAFAESLLRSNNFCWNPLYPHPLSVSEWTVTVFTTLTEMVNNFSLPPSYFPKLISTGFVKNLDDKHKWKNASFGSDKESDELYHRCCRASLEMLSAIIDVVMMKTIVEDVLPLFSKSQETVNDGTKRNTSQRQFHVPTFEEAINSLTTSASHADDDDSTSSSSSSDNDEIQPNQNSPSSLSERKTVLLRLCIRLSSSPVSCQLAFSTLCKVKAFPLYIMTFLRSTSFCKIETDFLFENIQGEDYSEHNDDMRNMSREQKRFSGTSTIVSHNQKTAVLSQNHQKQQENLKRQQHQQALAISETIKNSFRHDFLIGTLWNSNFESCVHSSLCEYFFTGPEKSRGRKAVLAACNSMTMMNNNTDFMLVCLTELFSYYEQSKENCNNCQKESDCGCEMINAGEAILRKVLSTSANNEMGTTNQQTLRLLRVVVGTINSSSTSKSSLLHLQLLPQLRTKVLADSNSKRDVSMLDNNTRDALVTLVADITVIAGAGTNNNNNDLAAIDFFVEILRLLWIDAVEVDDVERLRKVKTDSDHVEQINSLMMSSPILVCIQASLIGLLVLTSSANKQTTTTRMQLLGLTDILINILSDNDKKYNDLGHDDARIKQQQHHPAKLRIKELCLLILMEIFFVNDKASSSSSLNRFSFLTSQVLPHLGNLSRKNQPSHQNVQFPDESPERKSSSISRAKSSQEAEVFEQLYCNEKSRLSVLALDLMFLLLESSSQKSEISSSIGSKCKTPCCSLLAAPSSSSNSAKVVKSPLTSSKNNFDDNLNNKILTCYFDKNNNEPTISCCYEIIQEEIVVNDENHASIDEDRQRLLLHKKQQHRDDIDIYISSAQNSKDFADRCKEFIVSPLQQQHDEEMRFLTNGEAKRRNEDDDDNSEKKNIVERASPTNEKDGKLAFAEEAEKEYRSQMTNLEKFQNIAYFVAAAIHLTINILLLITADVSHKNDAAASSSSSVLTSTSNSWTPPSTRFPVFLLGIALMLCDLLNLIVAVVIVAVVAISNAKIISSSPLVVVNPTKKPSKFDLFQQVFISMCWLGFSVAGLFHNCAWYSLIFFRLVSLIPAVVSFCAPYTIGEIFDEPVAPQQRHLLRPLRALPFSFPVSSSFSAAINITRFTPIVVLAVLSVAGVYYCFASVVFYTFVDLIPVSQITTTATFVCSSLSQCFARKLYFGFTSNEQSGGGVFAPLLTNYTSFISARSDNSYFSDPILYFWVFFESSIQIVVISILLFYVVVVIQRFVQVAALQGEEVRRYYFEGRLALNTEIQQREERELARKEVRDKKEMKRLLIDMRDHVTGGSAKKPKKNYLDDSDSDVLNNEGLAASSNKSIFDMVNPKFYHYVQFCRYIKSRRENRDELTPMERKVWESIENTDGTLF